MSHGYLLMCVPCREALPVGKIVNLDEDGFELPWQLAGMRNDPDYPDHTGILIGIERFIILHRGHPLYLAPEDQVSAVLEGRSPTAHGWRDVAPYGTC